MTMYDESGTLVTKAAFPATADTDPLMVVGENVWERERYGDTDPDPEGTLTKLKYRQGQVLRQSEIDRQFPAATIDTITPATGDTGGGTEVTITGTNLTGVTAVNFDGNPGTDLILVSDIELTVVTPAGVGTVDVQLVDDAGNVTETDGYVYA